MQPFLHAALAIGLMLVPLGAQRRVLVVDDGPDSADFTEIHAAVAAAQDGDLVLVRPGRYQRFSVIAKSLTITAERPGLVDVVFAGTFPNGPVEIKDLAAGQSVTIRGLTIEMFSAPSDGGPVFVHDNAGNVWFEDCVLQSSSRGSALRAERSASVMLSRCELTAGLVAADSSVHAYDCEVTGLGGTDARMQFPNTVVPATPGADAIAMSGGFLLLSGTMVRGGDGGDGLLFEPGCLASRGGDGLVLDAGTVWRLDSTFAGGIGGEFNGSCGPNAADGLGTRVVSGSIGTLPGTSRSAWSNAVSQVGDPLRWTFDGESGDLAFALIGFAPAGIPLLVANGTLAIESPIVVPLGVVPPSGSIALDLDLPPLPGANQGVRLLVQGACLDPVPTARLSAPGHFTGVSLEQVGALGSDCNGNGVNDTWELMTGAADWDHNGVLDSCEVFHQVWVDDDAIGDPAPGDPAISDPLEDGSTAHPFDSIQEGLDAATPSPYTVVNVITGTYTGTGNVALDFHGMALTLRGVSGPAATVIDGQGTAQIMRFTSGETLASRVEGLRIINGTATQWGGAIFIDEASPTISSCEFVGNRVTASSGFTAEGGAIYARDTSLAVLDCLFEHNSATAFGYGGGLAYEDTGVIRGAFFRRDMVVRGCTFRGNSATERGGGLSIDPIGAAPVIDACTFEGNTATFGGGMNAEGGFLLSNSLFVGNQATIDGGGLRIERSRGTVAGCTFVSNDAVLDGGGIHVQSANLVSIRDSILWDNTATTGPQLNLSGSTATVTHSDFEGGDTAVTVFQSTLLWGSGNLAVDPSFANPAGSDYGLGPTSPCIDAGDPDSLPLLTELDRSGAPRRLGGGIDMGAFER